MLEDYIIANITETDDTQIILRRPFLATLGCTIDVKGARITFEVGVCYAAFCFIEDKIVSHNSFLSDLVPLSLKIEMDDDLGCPDPSDFD